MSFYRFARATAILALLRRYKAALARTVFAAAFALVTTWVYPDIALYAEKQAPHWSGWLLALKTLIVYVALFIVLWELHRAIRDDVADSTKPVAQTLTGANPKNSQAESPPNTLDALVEKPTLRRRKDALLDD